jgi:dolichol kinase
MNDTAWRGEIWRKVIHLGMIVLPLCIVWAPRPWSWRGPLLAFIAFLAVDFARLHWNGLGRWAERRLGGSLRRNEHRAWIWPVHHLTGVATLLALIAAPAVAATAVTYVVVGDAAAALVGRRFGTRRLGRKSVEGSLACLVCCLAAGIVFLPGRPVATGIAAGVATLVEALPLPVDDNWSVPLAGACVLALLA